MLEQVSALSLLVALFIGCALSFQPLDRGEGALAVIARGIIQGKLPYRDYFDSRA